jgi:hypothetical protein
MKHLLVLESESDFETGVKHTLAESLMEDICIETAKSVSDVLKKSIFWKSTRLAPIQNKYDVFVISL